RLLRSRTVKQETVASSRRRVSGWECLAGVVCWKPRQAGAPARKSRRLGVIEHRRPSIRGERWPTLSVPGRSANLPPSVYGPHPWFAKSHFAPGCHVRVSRKEATEFHAKTPRGRKDAKEQSCH